jgi:hypothetical protein
MNNDASLSDYVRLWSDKAAPRGTPRARRLVVLTAVVVVSAGLLMAFFYLAFGLVLGRFW